MRLIFRKYRYEEKELSFRAYIFSLIINTYFNLSFAYEMNIIFYIVTHRQRFFKKKENEEEERKVLVRGRE